MTNRAAGEIHTATGILKQTYGETVADAYGLVFYQAADGKLYRAKADAEATVSGVLYVCVDAATIADAYGNALAQGRVEKTGWSWTIGGQVYVSPTTAGGLTQVVPTGSDQIRPVGFATTASQIDFRPLWGSGATYAVSLDGITAAQGDILVRGSSAWGAVAGTSVANHPIVPSLLNRVLRIQDGAASPNTLEIHQAYIPFFRSAGFSQENLNDILCGGFWVDKFQACQPAASNVSRGGLTPNTPGAGVGAACKPHVVPWTDISWTTAKTVIENRGGSANRQSGTCAVYGSATNAKAEFLVSSTDHLIGRHVEIVQDGTTYYRRVIKQGIADEAKYLYVYPDLPADITTTDTYTIIGHHMITPYEWFSLSAWAMTFRYRHGLSYPKGNNDWGKDIGDSRAVENEGLADPVGYGYEAHEKSRCLTGSGPLSWSLNGQESGVWDLNGNVWEWVLQQVVSDGANISIAPGYPGDNTIVTPPGTSGQRITSLYAPDAPAGGLSLAADLCIPSGQSSGGSAEFGYDGYSFNLAANTYAAMRGGFWKYGQSYGLWALTLGNTPSYYHRTIGFRGAF